MRACNLLIQALGTTHRVPQPSTLSPCSPRYSQPYLCHNSHIDTGKRVRRPYGMTGSLTTHHYTFFLPICTLVYLRYRCSGVL